MRLASTSKAFSQRLGSPSVSIGQERLGAGIGCSLLCGQTVRADNLGGVDAAPMM